MNEEDVVGRGFEARELLSDGFVEAATDAVAPDGGLQDLFADYYGEAGLFAGIWGIDEGDERRADSFAMTISIVNTATRMEAVFTG